MTATAAQIAQLRRMTAEPTTTTYSDAALQGYIENYPLMDERGTEPYYWVTSGSAVPTKTATPSWVATYDMHAAAAAVWDEKAGTVAANYDFSADGGNYTRSQAYQQAVNMSKYHKSKANIGSAQVYSMPKESGIVDAPWIGNLPEHPDPMGDY